MPGLPSSRSGSLAGSVPTPTPVTPGQAPSEPRPPPQQREPADTQRRLPAVPGLPGGPPAPGPVPGEGLRRRRSSARPGRHERAARRRRPRTLLASCLAGKGDRVGTGESPEGWPLLLPTPQNPSQQAGPGCGGGPTPWIPAELGTHRVVGMGCARHRSQQRGQQAQAGPGMQPPVHSSRLRLRTRHQQPFPTRPGASSSALQQASRTPRGLCLCGPPCLQLPRAPPLPACPPG